MNVFSLLNNFFRENEREKVSSSATKLYFFLIYEANKSYWEGPLMFSERKLSSLLSFSKNTVSKSLSELEDRGLITCYPRRVNSLTANEEDSLTANEEASLKRPERGSRKDSLTANVEGKGAFSSTFWFPEVQLRKTASRQMRKAASSAPKGVQGKIASRQIREGASTPNSSEKRCFCKDPENCPTRGILDNKYMCSIFMNYLNGSRNYRDISPKIYLDASFDNFLALNEHLKKGLLKCRYFVEEKLWEKGVGLILYGGYGTGKSRLGFTVLKEAAVMGCTIGVLDVLRDFENFEGADAAVKRALDSDLIFIDDLGAKGYDWIGQKIRIVIDEVNRNQKSVIISTNLNPKELVNFLDDRTVSRLIEIVPKEGLIYLGEEDFRVKKREEKVAYFEQIR